MERNILDYPSSLLQLFRTPRGLRDGLPFALPHASSGLQHRTLVLPSFPILMFNFIPLPGMQSCIQKPRLLAFCHLNYIIETLRHDFRVSDFESDEESGGRTGDYVGINFWRRQWEGLAMIDFHLGRDQIVQCHSQQHRRLIIQTLVVFRD